MKTALVFLLYLLPSCFPGARVQLPAAERPQHPPSHQVWDQLLQKYVNPDGWVDYPGFASEREALRTYLQTLGDHAPSGQWSREARLAYFINLYNAATVALILEHYPLESIRDIPRPWGKKRVRIGDQHYSLGEIEHGILRKMEEPRIHFAINCASVSCPKLLARAFREASLEAQLQKATRDFINDPSRNVVSEGEARLSRIFKWYRKDFTTADTSLVDYLNPYLSTPLPAGTPVSYLPYDWSLNEKRP